MVSRSQKEKNQFFLNYLQKIDTKIDLLTTQINNYYQITKIKNNQLEFNSRFFLLKQLIPDTLAEIETDLKINIKSIIKVEGKIKIDHQYFKQMLSLLLVQLTENLNHQNHNPIFIFDTDSSNSLTINILNPPKNIKPSNLSLLIPSPKHSRDFQNDIPGSLANQIALHYRGFIQLYKYPKLDFIYAIQLPTAKSIL
ncbi:TPA: hypothetical protein DD455_03260 [Candidatus Shapirobacteria bacterium]|nr:hypothetical protein [Candidatus Shapirobacteria bacterium]